MSGGQTMNPSTADIAQAIERTRAEKVMFVKGDDNVPFADVASVIDIAHSAGVDKVGLITAKIEAGS